MPIRDYKCTACGEILRNTFTEKPPCPSCAGEMKIWFGEWSCGTMEALGPGSDKEYQILKDRFKYRNKRIMEMPEKAQEGFKRIIDSTNGKRYMP